MNSIGSAFLGGEQGQPQRECPGQEQRDAGDHQRQSTIAVEQWMHLAQQPRHGEKTQRQSDQTERRRK